MKILRCFPEWIRYTLLYTGVLWLSASSIRSSVPQFQLRDTEGRVHTSSEWATHKAIVLFFVTNDCPVTNSYVPKMNRIRNSYAARGVRSYAVQADPSADLATMAKYARAYQYSFPLLLDPSQNLVRLTGATVTPEAVVLSPEGKVLYRGRIDNRVEDFGKQHPEATVHDLRDALNAVLAGKPVPVPVTKSIGCAITRTK
ncbi:MAG TPA: thioredoxin family protein [Bryobacteraceae bacterium]|jgi:peroxiredoxin